MLTSRQKLVLAALYAGSVDSDFSPVQVQKLFFLIDREASDVSGGPHFSFEPYDYGPFDQNVYTELDALSSLGDVEVDRSGSHRVYRLTQQGVERGQVEFAAMDAKAQDYLMRAKAWIKSLSFRDLVAAIYTAYPDTKEKSIFRG